MSKIILVNDKNKLTEEQVDEFGKSVVPTGYLDSDGNEISLQEDALESFESLRGYIEDKYGYNIVLNSGYRSMDEQRKTFEELPDRAAEPGASEHHTGRALDYRVVIPKEVKDNRIKRVIVKSSKMLKKAGIIPKSLRYAEEKYRIQVQETVIKECPKFAFIYRYPPKTQDITGLKIGSEPWHLTYVGNSKVAEDITNNGRGTLEEYLNDGM